MEKVYAILEAHDNEGDINYLIDIDFSHPVFKGHFPGMPIVPGVILIEALAQTASILVMHSFNLTSDNKLVYFMSIEGAKFRKPVVPNDEIFFEVKIVSRVKSFYKFYGEAKKGSEKMCEAVFSAMIVEKK